MVKSGHDAEGEIAFQDRNAVDRGLASLMTYTCKTVLGTRCDKSTRNSEREEFISLPIWFATGEST